ncbi:MAG: hypothetical protein AAGF60_00755 [Pseudomonadota bacterium]
MRKTLLKFRADERGAVTVDWVVICAGVVVIAATIVLAMRGGAVGLGTGLSTYMGTLR